MDNSLIKRQGAIDSISTWDKFGIDERSRVVRWHEGLEPYVKLRDVVWAIEKLPSAQPERRGEWLEVEDLNGDFYYECSECKEPFVLFDGTPQDNLYNFCPNCGADMREEGKQE